MNLTKAILICTLLTYSYFVTFFYSSMIKTDMVTVKTPKIIGSYQDLVDDPVAQPFIGQTHDEYVSFKNATEGSVKRTIWERVLSQGIDKHVADSKKLDVIMSLANPDRPLLNTKAVMFGFSYELESGKYIGGLFAKGQVWQRLMLMSFLDLETISQTLMHTLVNELCCLKQSS